MNRTFDIRILALGLLVGVALLVRPFGAANASFEVTGSIPVAKQAVGNR